MRTMITSALIAAVLAGTAPAQDSASRPGGESRPLTAKDKVEAIDDAFADAQKAFFKRYSAAKTDEEKEALVKELPRPEGRFAELKAIAESDPKGPGAEAALLWIVTHDQSGTKSGDALDILARDHIESPRVADAADAFSYSVSPKAEAFLKALEEKNPHREVKGRALYARAEQKKNLARTAEYIRDAKKKEALEHIAAEYSADDLARLKALDIAKLDKEVEEMIVRVGATYADVKASWGGTLGERAEGDLFEIRNLAIGKVAPEVEGEDVQGKPMKLGDFRGKVVVLDFWGHW